MSDAARPDWASERTERYLTVAFIVVGSLFLAVAVVSAWLSYEAALAAWEEPGDLAPSRAVMHALNHEILAGFIGAVLLASGVLRLREE